MRKVISACLAVAICFGAVTGYTEENTKETEQPDIVIENDGKVLENGVDYYLTYRDNINVGTATLVVNFIGNYSGTQEKSFNIIRGRSSGGGGSAIHTTPKPTETPEPTSMPTVIPTEIPIEKTEHTAYIEGYNGQFRPESDMTRAEAATIFARLVSERKSEDISAGYSGFKDVDNSVWYAEYIAYLEKYDIISGYDDGTFKPYNSITRAEFTAVCTRFYELFDDISVSGRNVFCDVSDSYWAASYICADCGMEWIEGYDDGTFRPDNNITRAEVVSIINRVLDRSLDIEYIAGNIENINIFSDVSQNHWAYRDIVEASNNHFAHSLLDGECWTE